MKCRYLIFLILFFIAIHCLHSQIASIQLDRPDQTECPFIVPVNYIQLENGFLYENANSSSSTLVYPSTLWKYGLNDKFELRLITELATVNESGNKTTGLYPITLGFKTSICQENGIIPNTSFIGHLTTSNLGTREFHTSYVAPSFRFTMQHALTDKLVLAYNLGAEWNGETPEPTYIYTLTTGISLTSLFGAYFEIYGFAPKDGKPDHRLDGGITCLINNDLIIDFSGGIGITENAPRNYFALGISYRFKLSN